MNRQALLATMCVAVASVVLVWPASGSADPTFDYDANHDGVMSLVTAVATGSTAGLTMQQAAEFDAMQASAFDSPAGTAGTIESYLGMAAQVDEAVPDAADIIASAGTSGGLAAEVATGAAVEGGLAGGALVVGYAIGTGINRELHLSCSVDGLLGSGGCASENSDDVYAVWVKPMGHFLSADPANWGGTEDWCGCTPGYGTKDYDGTRHWHGGFYYDAIWGPTSGTTDSPYAGSSGAGSRPGTIFIPHHDGSLLAAPLPSNTSYPQEIGAFGKLQTLSSGGWAFWDTSNFDVSDACTYDYGASNYEACADWVTPASNFTLQPTQPPSSVSDATLSADGGISVPAPTPLTCAVASTCYTNIASLLDGNALTKHWIGHVFEPGDFPADPVTGEWTMPDCGGLSVSACESAVSYAAADDDLGAPSYTVNTASNADARLDLPAGAVIATTPASSSDGTPAAVTITKNPDPLPIVWPAAATTETYDDYLARLRGDGWLGSATVDSLGAEEGDLGYRLGGVPCTSVLAGSRIGPADPVTFYENPTSSYAPDVHGSDGGSCGGAVTTSLSDEECEFNDAISNNSLQGSWDATRDSYGPYTLDAECSEAWGILRSLDVLNSDNSLTEASIENAVAMDELTIANPHLVAVLPEFGSSIEFWRKVYIAAVSGEPLQTSSGKRFELHFYRDVSDHVYTESDFKVVFHDWFH